MKVGMTVEINGHLHHVYLKSVKEVTAFLNDLRALYDVNWTPAEDEK
jgi:hypothetical protein